MLDINQFWGKAQAKEDEYPKWHPLPFHCLDVAATAKTVLEINDSDLNRYFASLLEIPEDTCLQILTYLIATHDLGKFARRFQAKAPDFFPREVFQQDPRDIATAYDHATGGYQLFIYKTHSRLPQGATKRTWKYLISAVAGHHGQPPRLSAASSVTNFESDFGQAGIEAAEEFERRMAELVNFPTEIPHISTERIKITSHALAGLTVLCDWLGSNRNWFPYEESKKFINLHKYWSHTLSKSRNAIERAGIVPARVSEQISYDDLIPEGVNPTPMQEWVRNCQLPSGPTLYLIEDETGSGKTEASLMLAHRLLSDNRGKGIYVALPTMATANAMYKRLKNGYRHIFAPGEKPSLALVHSSRNLHPDFREVGIPLNPSESSYGSDHLLPDEFNTTASTACSQWIRDDRRRAFFADAGAGTIDQALLAILHNRYQSLRLFGLFQRVLILDEVHAYDAYMHRELEQLLEFQGALGGSAIMMSATLPKTAKNKLIGAYAKGVHHGERVKIDTTDNSQYPLVSVYSKSNFETRHVSGRSGYGRSLPIRLIQCVGEAVDYITKLAKIGKSVVYIRNTVDDALVATEELNKKGIETLLFHARFTLDDRIKIENEVLRRWGKDSTPEDRQGVLVATQVVEQSLDLDFDAMVTDLAPIDLLIQRAGRLWRHCRPGRSGSPELVVVSPLPSPNADSSWYSSMFPKAAYVYKNHARLWLTAHTLCNVGSIDSPGGLRNLVESVYRDEIDELVPPELIQNEYEQIGVEGASRAIASRNVIDLSAGYFDGNDSWQPDEKVLTRLNDDIHVTVRLCTEKNGELLPLAYKEDGNESLSTLWRLSEISISQRKIGMELIQDEYKNLVKVLRAGEGWSRYDNDKLIVILSRSEHSELVGTAMNGEDPAREVQVRYSTKLGLTTEVLGS